MTNPFVRSVFGELYCDPSIASEFSSSSFINRMLEFESAWTKALLAEGVVSDTDAASALQAIDGFGPFDPTEGSLSDGVPVPTLVKALRKELPESAAKAIHSGATSQDVIDSAMAVTLLSVESILRQRLEHIDQKIDELVVRFGSASMVSRTRMQEALPTQAGLRLRAWQRAVSGQIARADAARSEIAAVQVGGPIGNRTDINAHADDITQRVAAELGLSLTPVWHTDRSGPVSFGNWLTLVSGTMGKIGQDIALMSQQGVDEIKMSGGGGSSAMPHKQNPVGAEAMVTLARFVASQQSALAQAMVHEQERSGAAWALEWLTLPAMAEATGAALKTCISVLDRIECVGKSDQN